MHHVVVHQLQLGIQLHHPSKLATKLTELGLCASLCTEIFDFLINTPQLVQTVNNISSSISISTRAPQGCIMLSSLLNSIYTHDRVTRHISNSTSKFADDSTVGGRIMVNDEGEYR